MSRVRYFAYAALVAIVLLLNLNVANAATILEVELHQSQAPTANASTIDVRFNGKYYIHNGIIYQVNYVAVYTGSPSTFSHYRIDHNNVPNIYDTIILKTNDRDSNLSGGDTGSSQFVMLGSQNTFIMNDRNSTNDIDLDLASNGTDNVLTITAGSHTAGNTIEVGDGTITIGGNRSDTTIVGDITTDKGTSTWNIGSGTITGSFQTGGTGTGDTFNLNGNALFAGSGNITLGTSGNRVNVLDQTEFTVNSNITVDDTNNNIITVGGDAKFLDTAFIGVDGDYNTITITDSAEFNQTASIDVDGVQNYVHISGDAHFNGTNSITVAGGSNRIRVDGTASIGSGTTITLSGGKSLLDIYEGNTTGPGGKVNFNGTIILDDSENDVWIGANSRITSNVAFTDDGSGENNYRFHEWSEFWADWEITGDANSVAIYENNNFQGSLNLTGGGIAGNYYSVIVELFKLNGNDAPEMTGQVVFDTAAGASNDAINVGIFAGTLTNEHGSFISSNRNETNFIIGNDRTGVTTAADPDFEPPSVGSTMGEELTVNLLVSGDGAQTNYYITGGDVYNIRKQDASGTPLNNTSGDWVVDYVNRYDLTGGHTVIIGNGLQTDTTPFQSYSLLNIDTLETWETATGAKTITSIGYFNKDRLPSGYYSTSLGDTIWNQNHMGLPGEYWGQGDYGNQLTANTVEVNRNTKLILHADERHLNLDNADILTLYPDGLTIANNTTVYGELTIDRGSIHGSDPTVAAEIEVATGGILYGFGVDKYTIGGPYTDHWEQYEQRSAQLYGNLTLETGATLQPYDMGLSSYYYKGGLIDLDKYDDGLFASWDYDTFANQHRGSVFQVDDETGNGGTTNFIYGSIMRSRLFDGPDGRKVELLGESNDDGTTDLDTQYSDSLLTVSADFSDVLREVLATSGMDAQDKKVQYDPVFGFQYDLASKQEFQIYNDITSQDKTYYYAVVNSQDAIDQLDGYDDANHLFNKLILKSDMLGKYDFLKSETDDNSIYLRYRMLAYHPTQGGIKRTMEEYGHRNDITPGQYLDEIRYPFNGQPGSDLNGLLSNDPSAIGGYNNAGYNGDMQDFYYYATRAPGDADHDPLLYNPTFDNYRSEWIDDWANLFQGMQLAIESNRGLHRAVRMLHAETYANMSQTAFDVMNQFTRNRERNAVSALFQVENDNFVRAENQAEGLMFDPYTDMNAPDRFVCNPTRFWASGWGAYGRQMQGGGDEDGYDIKVWGGSVGVVQELGDYYLGVTIGVADSKNEYEAMSGTKTKSYIAEGLIGARIFDLGFAELYGSFSYNENTNSRIVDLSGGVPGGYYGVAKGEFDSKVFSGGIRFGHQKVLGDNWLFIPTIGFNVMHFRGEDFAESGRFSMANRMVFDKKGMNRTMYRVPVEFRLSRAVALGNFVFAPEVRAGFTPILGDRNGYATAKWIGNPIDNRYFTSVGARRGALEGWVGGTLELSRRGKFYMAGNYDYVYSNNYGSHNYSVQAGMNF